MCSRYERIRGEREKEGDEGRQQEENCWGAEQMTHAAAPLLFFRGFL